MPAISVIMPVYNVEEYMPKALDSLVKQTFSDFEVIMVNDGSTDGTLAVMESYRKKDPRFICVTQPNSFAGAARNNGLGLAKGKYVLFLDPDDYFASDMLEGIYAAAEKHGAEIVVFGHYQVNMVSNTVVKDPYSLGFYAHRRVFSAKSYSSGIFQLCMASPWNKLYLREYLEKTGYKFQTIRNTNDVFFTTMNMARADRIYCLRKRYVYYRRENAGSLQGSRKKSMLDFSVALKGIYDQLIEAGIYETFKETYMSLLLTSTTFVLSKADCVESYSKIYNHMKQTFAPAFENCDEKDVILAHRRILNGMKNKDPETYLIESTEFLQTNAVSKRNKEYKLGHMLMMLPKTLVKFYRIKTNKALVE